MIATNRNKTKQWIRQIRDLLLLKTTTDNELRRREIDDLISRLAEKIGW